MEYSGFIFASFVAVIGLIILLFIYFQEWQEAQKNCGRIPINF